MKNRFVRKKRSDLPVKRLPFIEHVEELRTRLLYWMACFVIGSFVGFFIHDGIIKFLTAPLHQAIFYTSPAGGFTFILNISLFFGFLITLPIGIYQIIKFIEPALPRSIPRLCMITIVISGILLLLGMGVAYFLSLPAALYFFNNFSTDTIRALISADSYFTFVTRYLLGFGIFFQLPLLVIVINMVHTISVKHMIHMERWAIVFSLVAAAILTPTPDIVNQLIMALPLIILYQATVILLFFINKKKLLFYPANTQFPLSPPTVGNRDAIGVRVRMGRNRNL